MFINLLKKIIPSKNDKTLKRLNKIVKKINALEPEFEILSDDELKAKTQEFKDRLKQNETLDDILPEAFATVREASKRIFNMRHFDVQLIGGMVLNNSSIAEMRTGEGKTLTATLPAYINALTDKGVHIITVNDYLAHRDATNNRPLFEFLGLSVGINLLNMSSTEKRNAYAADITYGTNNEFGFDYLRDNMVYAKEERVQRPLHYALIDEVDSILIDEARTPLIISGAADDQADIYKKIDKLIPHLIRQEKEDTEEYEGNGDYSVDEKARQANLTERGLNKIEQLLADLNIIENGQSLYSPTNLRLMHHVNAALKAHTLYKKDIDYIVKDDQVVIIDEHTGRQMDGRRWSDGLHQAVEAKENVKIQNENQTLASITFQNYFRLYEKLAGMTGTADTEAYEFYQIYRLDTIVIPTNRKMVRHDFPDLIFINEKDKFKAIIEDIKACQIRKQPVLVGTISIEKSEEISKALKKAGIKHNVLNAKYHELEAEIIAEAGRPGHVTIATNMAGRGTDIVLGGNWQMEISKLENPTEDEINKIKNDWEIRHNEVVAAGGLHIIGTERHESRRIDNQLRGRAGRQGDPGSSRFYLSLEDPLMRIFASDRIGGMMKKMGMKEGEAIEHPWVTKAIQNAQRKVESRNFDIRKQLLEFDDVANEQRKVIYAQRNELLEDTNSDISEMIEHIRHEVVNAAIDNYIPPQSLEELWNIPGLESALRTDFGINVEIQKWLDEDNSFNEESIRDRIYEIIENDYREKVNVLGKESMQTMEKNILLQTLDILWKEHLLNMDHLRQGIHLRGYAQKDPKQEYKRESFAMFQTMLETLKYEITATLSRIQFKSNDNIEQMPEKIFKFEEMQHSTNEQKNELKELSPDALIGISRNSLCPCNSGKKYKNCHGAIL